MLTVELVVKVPSLQAAFPTRVTAGAPNSQYLVGPRQQGSECLPRVCRRVCWCLQLQNICSTNILNTANSIHGGPSALLKYTRTHTWWRWGCVMSSFNYKNCTCLWKFGEHKEAIAAVRMLSRCITGM